jgi:hypothetical protein
MPVVRSAPEIRVISTAFTCLSSEITVLSRVFLDSSPAFCQPRAHGRAGGLEAISIGGRSCSASVQQRDEADKNARAEYGGPLRCAASEVLHALGGTGRT